MTEQPTYRQLARMSPREKFYLFKGELPPESEKVCSHKWAETKKPGEFLCSVCGKTKEIPLYLLPTKGAEEWLADKKAGEEAEEDHTKEIYKKIEERFKSHKE